MRAFAFSIHILSATGAALALLAGTRDDWPLMFVWLGIALIIDAIDGPLARRFRVTKVAPRWSGEVLDLVVDFTTYVFVPAYAIVAGGLIPDAWSIPAGMVIVITGALYFADRNMKTTDNFFRGFPAIWNLVAFYLLLLRPAPWAAAATVTIFAVLTFAPIRFVHPLRVRPWRSVTIALSILWAALAIAAVLSGLEPGIWIKVALCAIAAYFLLIGLLPRRWL